MKTPRKDAAAVQSATSLPLAPADDGGVRVRNYLLTMAIRIVCLCLAAFVTPHDWYTFVFAAGAIFLPYFAVVGANAVSGRQVAEAVRPDAPALEARAIEETEDESPATPTVIRISETRPATAPAPQPEPPQGPDHDPKPDGTARP